MRLWSFHPQYLDGKGLVAVWREGLLARQVLRGRTRGYQHHPQLGRFRAQFDPVASIDVFLSEIWREAARRAYRFDRRKIRISDPTKRIPVTEGQLTYEWCLLQYKLATRARPTRRATTELIVPAANRVFVARPGSVADWERPIKAVWALRSARTNIRA